MFQVCDPSSCALYRPGHRVHFIQAKLAGQVGTPPYRYGEVVSVEDDGWITVLVDGEVIRLWNHDPSKAREIFEQSAGRAGLPGYSLLHAPHEDGRRCICVADHGPSSCDGPPPDEAAPLERLKSHGGFLLPSSELRRLQEGS